MPFSSPKDTGVRPPTAEATADPMAGNRLGLERGESLFRERREPLSLKQKLKKIIKEIKKKYKRSLLKVG